MHVAVDVTWALQPPSSTKWLKSNDGLNVVPTRAGNDTAIADEDSPESTFGLPPMPEPVLETLRTDCSDRSSEMNSAEVRPANDSIYVAE